MAAANDVAGKLADLPDSAASDNAAGQAGHSLALLSLAAVIGADGTALVAPKPGQSVQFDTTVDAAKTDGVCRGTS